jgi:polysaccharide biosynthesis/export protein
MNMRMSVISFVVLLAGSMTLFAASAGAAAPGSPKPAPATPAASKPDYVLQPQDVLRVAVFQEEEINKQGLVSISQEYTVTLPLIQTISLKGRTVRQAEEMIRQLYDKDFLVNPQVNVFVEKYSERSVNVVGAVNKAGRIPFPQERGLTIVQAIALADGHSRLANLKAVRLNRTSGDGESNTEAIDVDAIMRGNREDVPLLPEDTVVVPERIL